jgi:hypothetical protein
VLLAPVDAGVARERERALQVDADDRVDVALVHVEDHPVAQDAGVVHDDVQRAERVDRLRTMRSAAFQSDTLSVLATASPPAALISATTSRRPVVGAGAVVAAAEVVHDHLGAMLREQQRLFAADAAAGPRDDRHTSVEQSHGSNPPSDRYVVERRPPGNRRASRHTAPMADALFRLDGDRFIPHELTRGPWAPTRCTAAGVAAPRARRRNPSRRPGRCRPRALDRAHAPRAARAAPVEARVLRPGKKVQWVEARLARRRHEVARATLLRIRVADIPWPSRTAGGDVALPFDGPQSAAAIAAPWSSTTRRPYHSTATEHRTVAAVGRARADDGLDPAPAPGRRGRGPSPLSASRRSPTSATASARRCRTSRIGSSTRT